MAASVGQVQNIPQAKGKKNYTMIGAFLVLISFVFIISAPDSSMTDVEDCFSGEKTPAELGFETCDEVRDDESNDTVYMTLWCLTCLPGLVLLVLGRGKPNKNQIIIVQGQQPVQQVMMQPVIQQPMIQQPVVQQQVAQPMQSADSMKAQFVQDKKLEHLKIAQQREMARDYEGAIREYEAAEEFSEAGRVRSLMQNIGQSNQAAPVQVNIGQVGSSVVQDSVVMANQQPSPQPVAAPQQVAGPVSNGVCRHCNAAITPGWQYCPSCNNPVS